MLTSKTMRSGRNCGELRTRSASSPSDAMAPSASTDDWRTASRTRSASLLLSSMCRMWRTMELDHRHRFGVSFGAVYEALCPRIGLEPQDEDWSEHWSGSVPYDRIGSRERELQGRASAEGFWSDLTDPRQHPTCERCKTPLASTRQRRGVSERSPSHPTRRIVGYQRIGRKK